MKNWGLDKVPLSFPVNVHFLGFDSDTLRLQRQGWQISMSSTLSHYGRGMEVALAMKHEAAKMYAITKGIRVNEFAYYVQASPQNMLEIFKNIHFEVECVSSDIYVRHVVRDHITSFKPIDCTPQWADPQTVNLKDIAIFKPLPLDDNFELYVPEKSVGELLEMIKLKQEPVQKEIREKKRKEGYSRPEILAQIISIGNAA